ncbi:hypothetical protein [Leptolyngbya sp. FACHB-16]|uniref:hypothetical protein n=1 Tax=unclassified Leptolyngbya TaxID=2650499 RepID=UPI00168363B5|nr:hypothetical protein [Leptolyngbya sp. FACHB-16]MBD2157034.1 hypothetical protein [Leptolyngbya sp. FACHB-16]
MAPRKGRSPVSANVSQQSLELATSALADLPEKPKTNYSLREAIGQLQDVINTALERGYSHQEVAEMLGEQGIRISPASLKSYLAAANREAAGTPKRRRTSKKTKAEQVEAISTPIPSSTESAPEAEVLPKKTRGRRTANSEKASDDAKAQIPPRRGRAAAKTKTSEEVATQVESVPEPEPVSPKKRGPRTANKAKAPSTTKGRKAPSTGTGTRRKKAGASS